MSPRLVTPEIEQLQPYEAGKPVEELAREFGILDAVKLASNENPLGPSPAALAAVAAAASAGARYPDASAFELRSKLAQQHGVMLEEVVHGNGSNEILELVVRAFTTRDHHIVFAEPSFVVYRLAALAQGVPFSAVPLKNWTHDLEAMAAAVTPKTRVLFIANPNNPTGTHVGSAELTNLLQRLPEEVVVVLDEAYCHYVDAGDYADGMTLRSLRERLIVVRTFSKIYGLAALRVGYAVGPRQLIDYLLRIRQPFSVNALAQAAACAALDDTAHLRRSVELNGSERLRLTQELSQLGYPPPPSQANFVFMDLRRPGREVYQALLRKGVIVRPFGDTNYLRVTVGTEEENNRFLQAFREVMT